MENNQNTSKLVIIQWIFGIIGVMMAISAFSKGIFGIFGGLFLLASAFVISPLAEKLPVYDKINAAKIVKVTLQFVVAFILCSIGAIIAPSDSNNTEDMSVDTSVEETQIIENIEGKGNMTETQKKRGRPKKPVFDEEVSITSSAEFNAALSRAEKLMRKSEEGLSASQSKRIEKELKMLMEAMNKYKEGR